MLGSVVGLCGGRLGEPRDVLLLGLLRPHVVRRGVLQVGPRVGDVWAAVDGWMLGRVSGDPLGALCGGPLRHAVRVGACLPIPDLIRQAVALVAPAHDAANK